MNISLSTCSKRPFFTEPLLSLFKPFKRKKKKAEQKPTTTAVHLLHPKPQFSLTEKRYVVVITSRF